MRAIAHAACVRAVDDRDLGKSVRVSTRTAYLVNAKIGRADHRERIVLRRTGTNMCGFGQHDGFGLCTSNVYVLKRKPECPLSASRLLVLNDHIEPIVSGVPLGQPEQPMACSISALRVVPSELVQSTVFRKVRL